MQIECMMQHISLHRWMQTSFFLYGFYNAFQNEKMLIKQLIIAKSVRLKNFVLNFDQQNYFMLYMLYSIHMVLVRSTFDLEKVCKKFLHERSVTRDAI